MRAIDPQRIEAARALKERGYTLEHIAATLGISKTTACRWTNPQVEAKNQEYNKSRRFDRAREAQIMRQRVDAGVYGRCGTCNTGLNPSNKSGTCQECISWEWATRLQELVDLWLEGLTSAELLERTEFTQPLTYLSILRRIGVPVPRRRQGGAGWIDPMPTEPLVITPEVTARMGRLPNHKRRAQRAAA